jgi:hypothetical protein
MPSGNKVKANTIYVSANMDVKNQLLRHKKVEVDTCALEN